MNLNVAFKFLVFHIFVLSTCLRLCLLQEIDNSLDSLFFFLCFYGEDYFDKGCDPF